MSERNRVNGWAACAFAGGAAAAAIGLPDLYINLPGGGVHVLRGFDVMVLAGPPALLAACAALAAGLAVTRTDDEWGHVAVGAALMSTLIAIALLALIDGASTLIPRDVLPATVRRSSIDIHSGAGLWAAFGASLAAAAAAAAQARGPSRHLRMYAVRQHRPWPALISVIVLLGLQIGFGVLRYEPWLQAKAGTGTYDLGAWGIPWIGPGSLLPLWLTGAAVALAVVGHARTAGLLACASGWMINAAAATTIAAGEVFDGHRWSDLLPPEARAYAPTVALTHQAWLGFGSGLAVAATGCLLIAIGAQRAADGDVTSLSLRV